ncbi:MAG TPA: ribosomal protein S18-alanine N-acetyltransferase [Gammaproteobacteria bacterium]|nr:ribosomal protein S18-alanine N-acetyltransferase [Gammaproteobacteria bacterium]
MNAAVAPITPLCRPMHEGDVRAVMDIERRAYQFHWTEGIFRDCLRVGYCCWVMEVDGAVIGYGIMSLVVGEAHLLNICIAPEWQRRGYGKLLLEHFMELARERGAAQMFLEVRLSNTAALTLYRDSGFNEVGMRKNYYPAVNGREDAMILAIEL